MNLPLRLVEEQLQKAARDNELLNDKIASLKTQIHSESLTSADDCKISLEKMERRTFELEKENQAAAQTLNRIRSLISR